MSGASAGQAPLHRLPAPGIAAADDEAEIGARLLERVRLNVGAASSMLVLRLGPCMAVSTR